MSYQPFKLPTAEDVIKYVSSLNKHGVDKKKLTSNFRIKGQEARREFKTLMKELVNNGLLMVHAKKYYLPVEEKDAPSLNAISLNVIALTDDGELLCEPVNNNLKEDFPLIILDRQSDAEVGDTIIANLKQSETEGEFTATHAKKKEKHETAELMGTVKVRPHGPSIFLPLAKDMSTLSFIIPQMPKGMKIQDGMVVMVEVGKKVYGEPTPVSIKEVVSEDIRGSEVAVCIHNHQLPHVFPSEVLNAASNLKPISEAECAEREDLRHIPIVTIDGEDAKDFDDAVWAEAWETEKIKGGYHLIVAIADVAHYVKEDSILDAEAVKRGNSVYFPGHVIPMLPEELSNNLCSLRPHEDRPTMVAHLWIDAQGKLHKYKFTRAVIHSHARLTYNQVQQALDGNVDDTVAPVMESTINPLYGAFKALLINRSKRGALDFDMPETVIMMDELGKITALEKRDRFDAHRLIEEMMVLANVAAASELEKRGAPCMYRVHPEPSETKIESLQLALKEFGVKLNVGSSLTPAKIQGAIDKIKSEDKESIGMVILRSQEQARYEPENVGHFGLALQRYAHFTSPIRRYSDLVVHRSLITTLKLAGHKDIQKPNNLQNTAEHLCITERRAQKAEWDAKDRIITRYYNDKIDEKFVAKISTVTNFGMFVSIDDGAAEGLLPLRHMSDDHYIFDEKTNKLIGKRTRKVLKVGDTIKVILSEADLIAGRLTFRPDGMPVSRRNERKTFKRSKPRDKQGSSAKPKRKR